MSIWTHYDHDDLDAMRARRAELQQLAAYPGGNQQAYEGMVSDMDEEIRLTENRLREIGPLKAIIGPYG